MVVAIPPLTARGVVTPLSVTSTLPPLGTSTATPYSGSTSLFAEAAMLSAHCLEPSVCVSQGAIPYCRPAIKPFCSTCAVGLQV